MDFPFDFPQFSLMLTMLGLDHLILSFRPVVLPSAFLSPSRSAIIRNCRLEIQFGLMYCEWLVFDRIKQLFPLSIQASQALPSRVLACKLSRYRTFSCFLFLYRRWCFRIWWRIIACGTWPRLQRSISDWISPRECSQKSARHFPREPGTYEV